MNEDTYVMKSFFLSSEWCDSMNDVPITSYVYQIVNRI